MAWIGVDLDGTLAHYDHWRGPGHIGPPVPAMLARVKAWLAEGIDVRIFTARICSRQTPMDHDVARQAIYQWSLRHLGRVLPVVAEKDYEMVELWDDRCVQVIPNTGERADGQE